MAYCPRAAKGKKRRFATMLDSTPISGFDEAAKAVRVVALVGVNRDVGREMAQEPFARPAIGHLTAGENKRKRHCRASSPKVQLLPGRQMGKVGL